MIAAMVLVLYRPRWWWPPPALLLRYDWQNNTLIRFKPPTLCGWFNSQGSLVEWSSLLVGAHWWWFLLQQVYWLSRAVIWYPSSLYRWWWFPWLLLLISWNQITLSFFHTSDYGDGDLCRHRLDRACKHSRVHHHCHHHPAARIFVLCKSSIRRDRKIIVGFPRSTAAIGTQSEST